MYSIQTKYHQALVGIAVLLTALVGHPDTAQAQNGIAFSPNPVFLTSSVLTPGLLSKDVVVTVNGQPATTVSGSGNTGYLSAAPSATPGVLTVIANTNGLQSGTYTGAILVTANNIAATLPVTLTVYDANTITLDRNVLSFSATPGGGAPASQTVNASGSVTGLPFTVASATTSGGGWLATAQTGTVLPAQIVVSVNPTGLAAGTYNGTVTVSSGNSQPQVINVTLTVSGQPALVIDPNPVNLLYQSGVGAPSPTATVLIGTTVTSLAYTGTVAYNTCGSWFTVASGLSGTTNAQLVITTNLAVVGTNQQCSGSITINAPGAVTPSLTIPVNLLVSTLPLLSVNPSAATFSYSIGGAVPAAQTITVSSSGTTALNYSISSSTPWLMVPAVPPNGFATPSTFALALNQSALSTFNPGTYTGSVVITALGSGNSPLTIPVTLTVSNNPLVTVNPPFVNFNYQTGTTLPAPVIVNLASTMGSLPVTISVPTTTTTQFVAFSPATATLTTTPTPLTLSLNPSAVVQLGNGTYTNTVLIAGGSGSQNVQVNLTVSSDPLVNVAPQQLAFAFALGGGSPAVQTLSFTSTNGSNQPVTLASSQAFLLVGPSFLSAPGTASVSVNPAGLTAGTYTAQIIVTSGAQVQIVPVVLTVTSGVTLSATPSTLAFTQAAGGVAPAAQTVTLGTGGNASLTYAASASTTTGGNWLSITGASGATFQGTAPGTFSVVANGAQLAPGTYNGTVLITAVGATNSSIIIPVTLTVSAQSLAVTPASLTFNAALLGAIPASQTINVAAATGITNSAFTATAQAAGGNWLSVTPASGNTPQNLTVSVNQAGLAVGTYSGTVTVISTTSGAVALTVPVTLVVGAQVVPVLSTVINAASGATGPIAPGELISLFGTNLGPIAPAFLTLTPQGTVATSLSNVQVLFDGIASPLTYVSATQINAVVPYQVFGRPTSNVVVTFNGTAAAALPLNIAGTAPGIFTLNSTGSGPAAALNQNTTVNGSTNPAAKGSTIVIYATGEGQTNPPGVTGSVTGSDLKRPSASVSVTVGGQPATVSYAGSAPGLVSGVLQLNVVVPAGAPSGPAVPVIVTVGSAASQQNATIAIQ